MTDNDFARRLAIALRREGLTLLMPTDRSADEVLDMIEVAMDSHNIPCAVYLSSNEGTAHFSLLTEDPRHLIHHNAFLNNLIGLKHFVEAKARGRYTRILRPHLDIAC